MGTGQAYTPLRERLHTLLLVSTVGAGALVLFFLRLSAEAGHQIHPSAASAAAVLYQNNATAAGGKVLRGAAAPMYAPDFAGKSVCFADVVTVVVDTIAPRFYTAAAARAQAPRCRSRSSWSCTARRGC